MEAVTSTLQHSHGPRGPNPQNAAQPCQGSQQPAPGAPRPEDQHHKPFFYIQPSQPYMPMQNLQWPLPVPMPMSYNPYYGYPGLGYGMPMMPHYQPNPYMEPPGFVLPHTHLHLMDYRRMLNPQYYQTMAYHARRFRYQQNSPTREMTSSEVQTESLSVTQTSNAPSSRDIESSSVLPVCSSSFVIQTEEVRIECCTTPVGLQLLHSHEAAEVSHNFSQDMVQCSSILQGHVLQDEGLCLPPDESEQALQVCPDILLVRTPSTGENIPTPDKSGSQMVPVISSLGSQEAICGEAEAKSEREQSMTKNTQLKVAHLPFDTNYLDELRKMESSVWSVEETLVPSPESLIQNGPAESLEETLSTAAEVASTEMLLEEEPPTEDTPAVFKMPPLEDDLEGIVPTVEDVGDEMVAEAEIWPMMDEPVSEETAKPKLMHTEEVALASNMQQLNSPLKADRSQSRAETSVQDCQDTSFESLPAYLPSTNWLADFDNLYYSNKLSQAPKKQTRPLSNQGLDVPTRRRKLDLEYKELNIRKPKEKYKPKGKVDRQCLSDHECCLGRNFSENVVSPYVPKRERLCSRCLAKHKISMPASPGLEGRSLKRKAVPFQQWNDALLTTCDACKSHTKRRIRKDSNPDLRSPHRGHDTEGESSENSLCRTGQRWRPGDDLRKLRDFKRPLGCKQNLEKSPAAMHPKLREKNCVCNELQHQPAAWERLRHCPHGNAIREIDENSAVPLQDKWRNVDQVYLTHRWQTEKSSTPKSDTSGSKNEARSQHSNTHEKSQSQGTRMRDTRC
ncbi:uncharacterized protein LOC115799800 isoform X2 [Archocentrus centrarchus]|uniref:uncharacterized protein LOC115799800 isoform X2 n=1 Tax=Archocentrus centrarchus TaxID=63155 RepID=UPI0011EA0BA1|nr:uncharacterized protein LOC115799800 isoform X2 [Archocentrus centrarchus]